MFSINVQPSIDPVNRIDQEINGCKVHLHFTRESNEEVDRLVLGHIMFAFDHRMKVTSDVQTEDSHLRQSDEN